jgi:hypothetical protein
MGGDRDGRPRLLDRKRHGFGPVASVEAAVVCRDVVREESVEEIHELLEALDPLSGAPPHSSGPLARGRITDPERDLEASAREVVDGNGSLGRRDG